MSNRKMEIGTLTHRFADMPRGLYPRTIKKFLDSGQKEAPVTGFDNYSTAYNGLRNAISNMGYKDRVKVKRQDGEIHLMIQE